VVIEQGFQRGNAPSCAATARCRVDDEAQFHDARSLHDARSSRAFRGG
jgi:hypothetical protein